MMKIKIILICIGVVIGYVAAQYLHFPQKVKQSITSKEILAAPSPTPSIELSNTLLKTDLNDQEKEMVLSKIRTFEELQAKRDGKAVLAMFTDPKSDKEQQELGFILGKDISYVRLYATAGFEYSLNWYYVTEINLDSNFYTVKLKELRTFYDNSSGNYLASTLNLTVKLTNDLKIDIINAQGQSVYSKSYGRFIGDFSEQYHLNKMASGVYVVKVQHGNNIYYSKLAVGK